MTSGSVTADAQPGASLRLAPGELRDLREAYRVGRARVPARRGEPALGRRSWRRTEIERAIREWVARYGEIPTVADLEPSRARRAGHKWRAERFEAGVWPSASVIRREFGTLSAAVEAAGFRSRPAPSRLRPKFRSEEDILEAIREWTRRYAEPPTLSDWEPSRARRAGQLWRIDRYTRGDWPSAKSVRNHFGSFSGAIQRAGLVPRPHGQRQLDGAIWRGRNREVAHQRRIAAVNGAGPSVVAQCMRAVAHAKAEGNTSELRHALIDLAAMALRWADQLGRSSAARGR